MAGSNVIADLLVQLRMSDSASTGLKAADKNFKDLNKTTGENVTATNKAGTAADGLKGKMVSLSTGFVTAIAAMGVAVASAAVISFFVGATKSAADYEMQLFSMGKTFGSASTDMIAKAKEMAEGTVYSNREIMESMTKVNDSFSRYGITGEQALRVISLGMDVAAAKGLNLKEATDRIESAMRGEAEASEYLGFTLGDTYMKTTALNGAYKDRWEKMTEAEKAQARYNEVLVQSTKYEGAATDAANTFSGKMSILNKKFEEIQINIGNRLIPVVTGIMDLFEDLSAEVGAEMAPEIQELSELFNELSIIVLPYLKAAFNGIIGIFEIFITTWMIAVNTVLGGVDILIGAYGALARIVKGDFAGAQEYLNQKMEESAGHFVRAGELTVGLAGQFLELIPNMYAAATATDEGTKATEKLNNSTNELQKNQVNLGNTVINTAGAFDYLASQGIKASATIVSAMQSAGMSIDQINSAYGDGGGGTAPVGRKSLDELLTESAGMDMNAQRTFLAGHKIEWVDTGGGDGYWYDRRNINEMAQGGIVTKPTTILAGEAGPEAVIPLSKYNSGGFGNINITLNTGNIYGVNDLEAMIKSAFDNLKWRIRAAGG